MKNLFKSMMLVAVAAMGFTACSNETTADVAPEMEQGKVTMTITAENTRTYLDEANGKAQWNDTGEVITAYQLIDDAENATFVDSGDGVITDGKANFTVTFDTATGTNYKYSAIYPACNGVDDDNKEALGYVKLTTPAIQKPTVNSFDSNADLMIAKVIEETEQPTELSMQFTRVVAIAKMSLTNLPTTDKLINVTFEASDKILGGRSAFDVTTGAVVEYGYNSPTSKITLSYADNPIANTNAVYFTCLPVELATGDTFTVTATTENNVKYTRTVTLGETAKLNFSAGNMSTFSVNMETANVENLASLAGEYAIIALDKNALHVMGDAYNTNKYITQTEVTGTEIPEIYTTSEEQYIWIVEETSKNGEYYLKQKSSNNYIYYSSDMGSNSASLRKEGYALTITKNNDGSVNITSVESNTRNLKYNSSSPRFAFYTTAQTSIYLVPIGVDTRTKLATPEVTATAEGKNVTVSWNAVENAGSYTLTYGDQTIENATSPYTFEGKYSTTYDFSVVAVPTDSENYKNSAAGTASVTTEADPNAEEPSTGEEVTVTLSCLFEDHDVSSWDNNYNTARTLTFDVAEIKFSGASKQASTITDCPVVKNQTVDVVMTNNAKITAVTYTCKQWGSKNQTMKLYYSTDGSSFTEYTTGVTWSNFVLTCPSLPEGTVAVRAKGTNSSYQIGIQSAIITYAN